ncbi:MAG TPA: class II fructose-bisphosphatase [Bdellovibrionota bacterium]|nr:class II fructose-bisphosphatase [Bdellovibrionota bacterium]
MDRNFAMEFVRVTEAAALESARLMGRGDEKAADYAAVEAMRRMLASVQFDGTVVIGEGERDEAPMLYIGEKVGKGDGPKLDLALDPLEGTTICARGGNNALSVIAIAEAGNFLHAPDCYMQKIAVGPDAVGVIDLEASPSENLKAIAKAKKRYVEDLTVIILDRPRHADLISEVRKAGARIWLIGDGDVSAAIATCKPESGVDVLMGIGGAPEGVIAAAALRCVGGDFQGKLVFNKDTDRERATKMGVKNLDQVFRINDLARGNVMFCATGVTQGTFLDGVRFISGGATTHSVVMRSETGTIRYIQSHHHFDRKPRY